MELLYKEDWEIVKKRLSLLWNNEIYDRPVVSAECPKDENKPHDPSAWIPKDANKLKEYYLKPELILERKLDYMERTYFGGDALPCIFPYWGTGGHSKYLHPKVVYGPETIWVKPMIEEYEKIDFGFDAASNEVFQAELQAMKYLAEAGKGKFFMTMPDNCGSYDALADLRNPNNLLLDFYDEPENVSMAGNRLVDILMESGNAMFEVLRENNDGGSVHGWYHTWSPGKHMQLQCDMSVMISPALFEEYIYEELERTAGWLDNAIYHMDGVEQIRHLDMILGIKKINMIQWVQVIGQPDVLQNKAVINKIQDAGKGVVIQATKNQIDEIVRDFSPKGLNLIVMDAKNPKEADEIVDYVAKNSFKKTLY